MTGTLHTIGHDLGRMLKALSGLIFISIIIPIVWREFWAIPALLISSLLPFIIGHLLSKHLTEPSDPGKLHGMMIAASGWFAVALFGALPFLLIAWTIHLDPTLLNPPHLTGRAATTVGAFRNPINAFFESMSGFTGTGLTMTDDESALPATLQWWRSFTEWIGGVGVIVLTTAILARPGSGSLTLYESEARSEKIHPSIVSTVRTIWWIFLLFTFLSILILWLAGMPMWDAINHGMTGLSTGGFSITDNSIGTYNSPLIDFALIPIMILGSIAFPIHYLILRGDLKNFYTDLQTRWVFTFFGIGTIILFLFVHTGNTYGSIFQSFRFSLFQFVSAASCTGFQTAETLGTNWSPQAQLTVTIAMVIGASAGSTVGGIKLIRALTIAKGVAFRINDIFYPRTAVRYFQINGRKLTDHEASREFEEAAIIVLLWTVFLGIGIFILLTALPAGEYSLQQVIFEVASAQGNVGLSSGITGPGMPTPTKILLVFNMWIGRLEIIPVLVILRMFLPYRGPHR